MEVVVDQLDLAKGVVVEVAMGLEVAGGFYWGIIGERVHRRKWPCT